MLVYIWLTTFLQFFIFQLEHTEVSELDTPGGSEKQAPAGEPKSWKKQSANFYSPFGSNTHWRARSHPLCRPISKQYVASCVQLVHRTDNCSEVTVF